MQPLGVSGKRLVVRHGRVALGKSLITKRKRGVTLRYRLVPGDERRIALRHGLALPIERRSTLRDGAIASDADGLVRAQRLLVSASHIVAIGRQLIALLQRGVSRSCCAASRSAAIWLSSRCTASSSSVIR